MESAGASIIQPGKCPPLGLTSATDQQMFLGYIKDTTAHDILTSLGIYNSADTTRDATRAVVWNVGAEKPELVEFEGLWSLRC